MTTSDELLNIPNAEKTAEQHITAAELILTRAERMRSSDHFHTVQALTSMAQVHIALANYKKVTNT